jgi:hypothetical protein
VRDPASVSGSFLNPSTETPSPQLLPERICTDDDVTPLTPGIAANSSSMREYNARARVVS